MSNIDDAADHVSIPDSFLTIDSVETAVVLHSVTGLKTVLLHTPTPEGGCSCGKVHDKTAGGSSSTGKHPILPNWQKKEFSLDQLKDQIARSRFVPNIGIVLGKQPDGDYLIAVDVDDADRFAELEVDLGPLPETPRCDSGRGYRLFFRCPPEIDTDRLKNATALGSTKEHLKPGVDVKVEGGQVVVAPSLHANGKRYQWTVAGEIAALPVHWAMQLLSKLETPKFVQKHTPAQMNKPGSARNRAERYLEVAVTNEARALASCGQGNRNNTLYSVACRMFEYCGGLHQSHRWQWVHDELLSAAKTCGLTDHESRATLASAERRIRETGGTKVPMVLADPAPSRPRVDTLVSAPDSGDVALSPPPDDPWQLAPESQFTRRPTIRIDTELDQNVVESIKSLRADPEMYQRGGKLVHVVRVTREEIESSDKPKRDLVEGSPQIRPVSRAVIKGRLSKFAVFQKWVQSTQGFKTVLPTDDIVGYVHDADQWPGIRSITGVIETPALGPSGVIMQTPGYDRETGYLYMPSGEFPEVKDNRTSQEDARWALRFLNEVFCDFPYVNNSHRSVPIAAILTLVARPAIDGSIPAVLFDASTRGSGKTLQTDAVAMISTGRVAPRMNYTSDDVELEKILGGYALKGSQFICLDNVPTMRPFGGGPIDRCITARGPVDLRILGQSHVPTLEWKAMIMATGNNMTLHGDTSRRVLMARLEPNEESPERRESFRHQDLLAYVRIQRPRLVAAALLILRAYWRAGLPDMGCSRWGSFEEWSRLVPQAIVFAGGADPMLARPDRDEEVDVEMQALSCVLTELPKLHAKLLEFEPESNMQGVSARHIVSALYEQAPEWSEFEALRGAIELLCRRQGRQSNPDATTLGYKLRAMRSRVLGGKKLVAINGPSHTTLWHVS